MKIKYLTLLLTVLMACALSGCHKHSGLQIGDPAPTATLTDFHGKAVTLSDAVKGKVALVHFWSMDCDFCSQEIVLALEPLYQKYKANGFVPITINTCRVNETDVRLKKFEQLTFPMLVDEYGLLAKQFGVIGLPSTFVLDEQGIVQEKITGEATLAEYEKLLTTVLNKGVFYENGH
jgi:peroxiredoxin